MKNLAFTAFILCFLASPAHAQQRQYSSGIKYTTMRPTAEPTNRDKQSSIYNQRAEVTQTPKIQEPETQDIVTESNSALPKAPTDNAPQKTSEQSVWDKYKELASGRTEEPTNKQNKPTKPEKPSSPQQVKTKNKKQQPTGIGAIIADYQRNKANGSRIQSMSFSKPKKPAVAAPNVEKPVVKKEN